VTTDTLIDNVITREGGFVHAVQDRGGATNMGITAATLGAYRRLGRVATDAEVRALTRIEAADIYRIQYCKPFDLIPFDELKASLVDSGVLSGVTTTIRLLQRAVGVVEDGVLGDRTRAAIVTLPWKIVANAFLAARVELLTTLVQRDASQREFFFGWVTRAMSFYVP
jgi:lysozyme family protein